jgi:hypothetical protein
MNLLAQGSQFSISFNLGVPQLAHFRGEVSFSADRNFQGLRGPEADSTLRSLVSSATFKRNKSDERGRGRECEAIVDVHRV